MRGKELFYYVTSGSNGTGDVHWWVTVDYQQIENDNMPIKFTDSQTYWTSIASANY